ncbi:MAG: hypothetical protein HY810_04955 [Candidatus Omnitrophica bacterium]|nr:hypothetical protein [Candidatus Omnitrophota bacterium]
MKSKLLATVFIMMAFMFFIHEVIAKDRRDNPPARALSAEEIQAQKEAQTLLEQQGLEVETIRVQLEQERIKEETTLEVSRISVEEYLALSEKEREREEIKARQEAIFEQKDNLEKPGAEGKP